MRLLFIQNSLYYPAFGGGNKSSRLLAEAFAARGHACRVLTRTATDAFPGFLAQLSERAISFRETDDCAVEFALGGVGIRTENEAGRMRRRIAAEVRDFLPDRLLVSTDDPLQLLLPTAVEAAPERVLYLIRTTLALPFGPDAVVDSPAKAAFLRRLPAVAVSNYARDYAIRWGGMQAVCAPISPHGGGPFPNLGRYDQGYVTLVNPCALKGISIFVELARRFPAVSFAAVPTWGTNAEDVELLSGLPNVTLLPPAEDIDDILRQTRILLVPSLGADAKPRIVTEGMARGIPVLASNVGGIPEVKLGLDYVLPVRPIHRYEKSIDSQLVPKAVVPEQDIEPWAAALRNLVENPARYRELSRQSHAAAAGYLATQRVELFEEYLKGAKMEDRTAFLPDEENVPSVPGFLSPEKRALLALRLRQQRKH